MFCYIILHYKNIEETITCVQKINKIKKEEEKIVIVDNNTFDDIQYNLLFNYTSDIIRNSENLGFAKANNKAIKYAKDKYNANYYVVINNDVFIDQIDFEQEIINMYKEYSFDMLGPKIDSPTKESVNPFPVLKNKEEVKNEINRCNKLIKIYNSSILTLLLNGYVRLKKIFIKSNVPVNSDKIVLNQALHGCCIIFSAKYINKYEYPFYNGTFLFHEEEFLYNRIISDNLCSVYDPNLCVYHKEGSSIRKNYRNSRLSKLFRQKEKLKSLKLLLDTIK